MDSGHKINNITSGRRVLTKDLTLGSNRDCVFAVSTSYAGYKPFGALPTKTSLDKSLHDFVGVINNCDEEVIYVCRSNCVCTNQRSIWKRWITKEISLLLLSLELRLFFSYILIIDERQPACVAQKRCQSWYWSSSTWCFLWVYINVFCLYKYCQFQVYR